MSKEHGLRSLAKLLMDTARTHTHFHQALSVLQNMNDHLSLLAAYYEGLDRDFQRDKGHEGRPRIIDSSELPVISGEHKIRLGMGSGLHFLQGINEAEPDLGSN